MLMILRVGCMSVTQKLTLVQLVISFHSDITVHYITSKLVI